MKTQEEIKQLAKEKCTTLYNGFFGYIQGYTQCQEDMADEIAELKMLCLEYSKDVKKLNDIINLLNKQINK
jgi:hypothetical protein